MSDAGRILLADDEEGFLKVHAELLREEGYNCDCAPEAHTAKEMLRQNQYDLLIADIKMPGNEELSFIQEVPALVRGLPVILVTGYPSLDTAIKSTRLAVAGYMVKPVPIDDFLKLVRESVVRYETVRMFDKMRERMRETYLELGSLESLKQAAPNSTSLVDVDLFLQYTMRNMMASMFDLKDMALALANNKAKEQACQVLNCPRNQILSEAVKDAILTLEKTKSSFRSKELALLRTRLEKALGQ